MNTIRHSCSYKRTAENTEICFVTSRSTFLATGEQQTASSFYDSFIAALPSWKVDDQFNIFKKCVFKKRFVENASKKKKNKQQKVLEKENTNSSIPRRIYNTFHICIHKCIPYSQSTAMYPISFTASSKF